MVGALFAVGRGLAVGEMDITIGRGQGPDWRVMGGSDVAKMIWLQLVEAFVIMAEMADASACSGDVECRLARWIAVLETR
jgi:hypothetical protein